MSPAHPMRRRAPPIVQLAKAALAMLCACCLVSCEAFSEWHANNVAYWQSPAGRQQSLLLSQQAHERALEADRQRHEILLRSMPTQVHHTGSMDIEHSGTIHVRVRR